MTAETYITQKFQSFGISLSEADLLDASLTIKGDAEVTALNLNDVLMSIRNLIPQILAHPTTITEGGMTIKWDREGLLSYYRYLCKQLGVADESGVTPQVTFINLKKRR
jgi:hypothetical protein